jgi:hypothetical protein
VLAINPKLLIFVEGNDCYSGVCGWQGGNLIGVASHPVVLNTPNQLVYSAHDYGPNLFEQAWFNGSTTPASLDAVWNKYWGYISGDGTAPVWLGEFGTDNTSADIENTAAGSQGQWFESLVSYLQNNPSINWTYWALNGEDTYALLDGNYDATPSSSLKQSELESIQFPLGGAPSPGFTIKSSVSALSVAQGSSGAAVITVIDSDGFTGGVTLAASNLPSGVTAAFSTNPASSTSVVTFTVSNSAPQGATSVTITGSSGALLPSTATIALSVGPPATGASFTLTPSPTSLSVTQGKTANDTITVTGVNGFTGSVTLAASGLPGGVTVRYGANPTTGSSVLTFTASATATTGTSTVTITGTSGSTTAKTTITLTVVSTSPSTCTVDYVISPQNTSAFGAAIGIFNTGTTAWTSWTLTWSFANGQTISSLWNGNEIQSGAKVTVTNQSYNGSIAAGGSYTGVGFNGTWNGVTNAIPTSFAVNGTACTVN